MKNENISIVSKEQCCGCSACYSVCGKQAISMRPDEQGFKYPEIDVARCVGCGLCVDVCPGLHPSALQPLHCYGVKHKDKAEQLSSTSGGFAAALAQNVVGNGGVAFGVVLKDVENVVTVRVDNVRDLHELKGSKYVQTDPQTTFCQAADDLKQGRDVVYFATSCHIDGLLRFMAAKRIDTARLLTVDLICHGVPSPMVYRDFIKFLSRRNAVSKFYFRTQAKGWGYGSKTFSPSACYANGEKEVSTPRTLAFQQLFFSNNCLRPHCFQCPYAGHGRVADFTIADFWGLYFLHPEKFDRDGVSLVMVNTQKGMQRFGSLDNILHFETSYENACLKQANTKAPSTRGAAYDEFWRDYAEGGIDAVLRKYTLLNPKALFKYHVKKVLAVFIKRYR